MNWLRVRKPKDTARNAARSPLHGWRLLLILIVATVLGVLFYAEEDWRGQRAWEKHRRQLETEGVSLNPAAYVPPVVPDDENFAMTPFLAPLFTFMPGTQQWRDPNALARVNGLAPAFAVASSLAGSAKAVRSNSWVKAPTDLKRWHAAFLQGTNRANNAKDLAVPNASLVEAAQGVLAGLAEADDVMQEVQAATQRRYARFNLKYDHENPAAILLPHLAALKHICQIAQLRASAALALGLTDQALGDINLILSVANATRDEPIIISQLVRRGEVQMAFQPLAEGLEDHRWSEAQLRRIQEQLETFHPCADLKRALQSERALFGIPIIEAMRRSSAKYRHWGDLSGRSGSSGTHFDVHGLFAAVMPSGWFYFEQLHYSSTFQEDILPVIDETNTVIRPADADKASARVTGLVSNTPTLLLFHHRVFSALLLPGVSGMFQKTAFAQTGIDTAVIACALERYRLSYGRFPESLELLVPQFIGRLPHDVINGQALKYRRTESGSYLLYSVGWNGTDEGGRLGAAKNGEGLVLDHDDWVWSPEL